MRALITGAGGQVGRALAATAPQGWDVALLDRATLDIGDRDAVAAAVAEAKPDILFNAAAYTAVDKAESEVGNAERINGTAVAFLAEACRTQGARLVHFSTDFVFGGQSSTPYRPDHPTAPLGVYGRSKLAGEGHALTDPANLVIRTAWVYGTEGANFVRTMLCLMGERDKIRVVADQVGTPTHTLSLAQATWRLAELDARGVHHFTDAGVASWYDFAVAIEEEGRSAGLLPGETRVVPIPTADYPTPARRPAYSVLDKTATWDALGGPARHWRSELRDMVATWKIVSNG